jgi:hypothetical protein
MGTRRLRHHQDAKESVRDLLGYCLSLTLALVFITCASALALAQADAVSENSPSAVITLQDINSEHTPAPGNFRWLDVADQPYGEAYRTSYNYTQATVSVTYVDADSTLHGTLTATNLKPNFSYQLKLVGTSGTVANERIGLAGRWWQEEWNGSEWTNGQNLNDKGDGSSPNPNDDLYFLRRDIPDPTSPTSLTYSYTGYLVFDYFTTDEAGNATLAFQTDSSYHVLWKTSQRAWTMDDGPLKPANFDADLSTAYDDTGGDDWPSQTVSIFGEWERLPVGGVYLQPGEYLAQMVLTEESFHGSGGTYAGSWAGAMSAEIPFAITSPTAVALASFTATPQAGAILLAWETTTELDSLGFNLYRASEPAGALVRLNAETIPAQNPGTAAGAGYEFVDGTAWPNVNYYYWLEYLDVYGRAALLGPASAVLPGFHLYLPLVVRSGP